MKIFAIISLILGFGSIYETINNHPAQLPIACILIGIAIILGLHTEIRKSIKKY